MSTSGMFKLNAKDFLKGGISAVFAAVVFAIGSIITAKGFDLFSADWMMIANIAFNAAVSAFVGYIGKQFVSDAEGRPFGSQALG